MQNVWRYVRNLWRGGWGKESQKVIYTLCKVDESKLMSEKLAW